MGADLYIQSRYDEAMVELRPQFEEAVARRNRLEGQPGYREAHAEVARLYERMYAPEYYFRDSYNASSLLACLDLSWWRDVVPLLDDEGNLHPGKARGLCAELAQRAEVLEHKIAQREFPFEDPADREEVAQYQRARLGQLIDFLERAIAAGEPVNCSL